ncbi:TlpA family protein disulfide reductase [Lewinella sp. IMCC34183]|uniref:TlpA family protein disulfide reductase n=1 Tax=Lewinella sp. IMCC34183 TaxID=2248762 RepID=UPI000E24D22C|nr:TlpA disulfide reductase family protein [Lewinella sp. IMCC34183]
MLAKLRWVLDSWWFPIVLVGGLYLTGLHTPVMAFLQRGILATGLFQPDTDGPDPGAEERVPTVKLDFHMVDADGRSVDAGDLTGKVVFLNLWASWCPPCLAEMPNINALYADYAGDERVAFVLLNVEADFTKGVDYVRRHGYDFPVYHLRGNLPEELRSGTLPTTYVISPDGEVVVAHEGMARYDTRKFRALLNGLRSLPREAE